MSQTSIERLREYLAQLPPQSQALLMREFERALERGQDTAVATLVLDQLRRIVRAAEPEEDTPARSGDPARVLFQPLEPFLVDAGIPIRVGQIRRSSLHPIWQWLGPDGAPEQVREFETALVRAADSQADEPARQLQGFVADGVHQPYGHCFVGI